MDLNALEKTNRINLLFDFYKMLLTEKQQTFLQYYFHEDYSLGEIASQFAISRQAVYEHIKRAETTLEDYESKLALLKKHERRTALLTASAQLLEKLAATDNHGLSKRLELPKLLQLSKELLSMEDDRSEGGESHGV